MHVDHYEIASMRAAAKSAWLIPKAADPDTVNNTDTAYEARAEILSGGKASGAYLEIPVALRAAEAENSGVIAHKGDAVPWKVYMGHSQSHKGTGSRSGCGSTGHAVRATTDEQGSRTYLGSSCWSRTNTSQYACC